MNQTVLLEIRDRIARITLNRPDQGNALNIAAAEDFKAAVDVVANDPSLRVVLLTGTARASVAAIATLVDGAHQRTRVEQVDLETGLMIASAGTADAREGVLAFTQKRKPEFLP